MTTTTTATQANTPAALISNGTRIAAVLAVAATVAATRPALSEAQARSW